MHFHKIFDDLAKYKNAKIFNFEQFFPLPLAV